VAEAFGTLYRKDGLPDGRSRRRLPCVDCGGERPPSVFYRTGARRAGSCAIPMCYRCQRIRRKTAPERHRQSVKEAMQRRDVIAKMQRASLRRWASLCRHDPDAPDSRRCDT